MLSIKQCRQVLGSDFPGTDEEVQRIRDQLMQIADVCLDMVSGVPLGGGADE